MKIVIIGGGAAGLFAATQARKQDAKAEITLVCGEKILPYYRTRICEVFSGLEPKKLLVHDENWFTEQKITVINDTATKLLHSPQSVLLVGGKKIEYDRLILAIGANGNRPNVEGADQKHVLALRTLDDIAYIQTLGDPIAIVGGGLLGLEAAWHLALAKKQVTIVEFSAWLLKRQLDQEASMFFQDIVKSAGIEVILDGASEQIEKDRLILKDGRSILANTVIFAAGIVPTIDLAKEYGLTCNRAIVVNEYMETSQPGIYACGDCAELDGKTAGLWTVSMAQGIVAGQCAAGNRVAYTPQEPPYLMNAMGTKIWSGGSITSQDTYCIKDDQAKVLKKLFFAEGKLQGAILIGDVGAQTKIKKAIGEQLPKEEAIQII